MLSILPYERSDRDADRPFKSYPRVPPVSVPPTTTPQFYGHYSASAFVGRHPSSSSAPRGALDLTGMDLRHGMASLEGGPPHMDMSQQRDHNGGHHMPSQMAYPQQHQQTHDYLGRAGQPGPLPHHGTHLPPQDTTSLQGPTQHSPPQEPPSSHSPSGSNSSGEHQTGSRIPPKKRPLSVPDEQKDNGYWEKRKKNNESAKRSRDARRMKEEQIAMRVVYLEQENLQLRTEVSLLKTEIEKLRCMLYNS
uniref:Ces2 n=1 Tax=Platynereis dumerilii TaxID=6359 RepID=W5XJE8_PLADU|nr:ces2 [Platynereis dumerilii]